MISLENKILLTMAVALGLATMVAFAHAADASIQARAATWHQARADLLAALTRNEAEIRKLGGEVRIPPALAVRFDQNSLQEGLAIIQAPARDVGDILSKITIARALDLPELRTQYGMEAIEIILADVEVVGEECE